MKQRTCYWHVGTGKTGSTAIQYALIQNDELLRDRGYSYPDISGNFRKLLNGIPTAGNAIDVNRALAQNGVKSAVELLVPYSEDPRHLILSCEGFSNRPPSLLKQFAAELTGLGYTLKVLFIVRPQPDFILASYLQRVKTGRANGTLEDEIQRAFRSGALGQNWNWRARAEQLADIAGEENLTVKWYPALVRRGPEATPQAAFDWLGLGAADRVREANARINPSPGRESLHVFQKFTQAGLPDAKFGYRLFNEAARKGLLGSKIELDANVWNRIHWASAADNAELLRRFCKDLNPDDELKTRPEARAPELDLQIVQQLETLAAGLEHDNPRGVRGKLRQKLKGA